MRWMVRYAAARLREPSTWRGLVAAVAALSGWTLSTELQAQIVVIALGVVGLIGMLFPDSGLGGEDARPAGSGDRSADSRLPDPANLPGVAGDDADPGPGFDHLDRFSG